MKNLIKKMGFITIFMMIFVVTQTTLAFCDSYAFIWENGTMTDLGALEGDSWSRAIAINDSGQVVGDSKSPGRKFFIWENGIMSEILGNLPNSSDIYDINNKGQVIFDLFNDGYVWEDGIMTRLGYFNSSHPFSIPLSINNNGQIVGSSRMGSTTHAFLWEDGIMSDLGYLGSGVGFDYMGINDHGQIVGSFYDSSGYKIRPFFWEDGVMTELNIPGDMEYAMDINNYGHTIINIGDYAYLWRDGNLFELGAFYPKSINDNDEVVGFYYDAQGKYHGVLWKDGVIIELEIGSVAFDINNNDQVVGLLEGYDTSSGPVPEPATILLLGAGLIGLAGFGRKMFKK